MCTRICCNRGPSTNLGDNIKCTQIQWIINHTNSTTKSFSAATMQEYCSHAERTQEDIVMMEIISKSYMNILPTKLLPIGQAHGSNFGPVQGLELLLGIEPILGPEIWYSTTEGVKILNSLRFNVKWRRKEMKVEAFGSNSDYHTRKFQKKIKPIKRQKRPKTNKYISLEDDDIAPPERV
ncbi:hypothetical protein RJ641_009810 [Dillenia turbinata]|uniref:Uncharacterized protein n=1 Tax=Dillenia turbinata TaxID=194707 RepID=A0AAN8Z3U3_9MAGN